MVVLLKMLRGPRTQELSETPGYCRVLCCNSAIVIGHSFINRLWPTARFRPAVTQTG
jgi:hypothetical protein